MSKASDLKLQIDSIEAEVSDFKREVGLLVDSEKKLIADMDRLEVEIFSIKEEIESARAIYSPNK